MTSKWDGFGETFKKIQKGEVVTKEEKDKYYQFLKELSPMLDEVSHIVGRATCSFFWMEIHREESIRRSCY